MDEPSRLALRILAGLGRVVAPLKTGGAVDRRRAAERRLALELADDIPIIDTGEVIFAGTPVRFGADESIVAQNLGAV